MRVRVASLLVVGVALLAGSAGADVSVNVNIGAPPPPPVVLAAPPPLVVVPAAPIVSYAPSIQLDLFFFDRRWYYSHGGYWYVGPSYKGPWKFVPAGKLPRPIFAIPVKYYKEKPGHLKKLEGGGKGKGKGH